MTKKPVILTLSAAFFLFSAARAHAGIEEAASAVSTVFKAAAAAPALKLIPSLQRFRASSSNEDELVNLLDDENPAVRAQAAKALRDFALNSWRAENKLIEVIDRNSELESVKREAIKSLAWAAQHSNTKNKILAVATDERQTPTLRSIAFKSLYVAVSRENDVRRALQNALESDREPLKARAGAAWGLWGDSLNDYQTRRSLLGVAQNDREATGLRVEALKSLYSAMNDWQVKNPVESMAKDSRLPEALREAAILSLHAVNQDWSVRNYLEEVARRDSSPVLRMAAIKALGGQTLELARYFHISWYLERFIDPLEDQ